MVVAARTETERATKTTQLISCLATCIAPQRNDAASRFLDLGQDVRIPRRDGFFCKEVIEEPETDDVSLISKGKKLLT